MSVKDNKTPDRRIFGEDFSLVTAVLPTQGLSHLTVLTARSVRDLATETGLANQRIKLSPASDQVLYYSLLAGNLKRFQLSVPAFQWLSVETTKPSKCGCKSCKKVSFLALSPCCLIQLDLGLSACKKTSRPS